MEQKIQSYNLAIRYMQDEMYSEASSLLEKIVDEDTDFSEALWALGLIDVLTGFPYKALEKWKGIRHLESINLDEVREIVQGKLPLYAELYERYNESLELLEQEEYKLAADLFDELLSYQIKVPLPLEFYYGSILTKILIGQEKFAFDESIAFPAYVRKNQDFQEVEELLHQYLEKFRNSKAIFQDKSTRPKSHEKTWYSALLQKILGALKNILSN